MNKIVIFICFGMLFFSCRPGENKPSDTDYQNLGDTLYIPENSAIYQKIKLQAIQTVSYNMEYNTTGTVKAISGKIAEIAAPFDGRVIKSYIHLGQRVKAGTPVFELSSTEFYENTRNYFQALQTKKMMERNLQRQKDLVQHGVGIQKELEELETNYEMAQNEYENAVATLRIFNIDPANLVMGQALQVVSPIDGEIVQNNMIIGQYVKSDADPLAIVADLSKVWVIAQVKEKYIGLLQSQDKVEIHTDANPDQTITGHVYHISELLDEETRSIQVLVACDNEQRYLKPGMFTSVHFINLPKESIIIPSKALLQSETDSYVFVQVGKERFLKRFVKVTTANQGEVLIIEGLQVGDVIVSEGGIYLMTN